MGKVQTLKKFILVTLTFCEKKKRLCLAPVIFSDIQRLVHYIFFGLEAYIHFNVILISSTVYSAGMLDKYGLLTAVCPLSVLAKFHSFLSCLSAFNFPSVGLLNVAHLLVSLNCNMAYICVLVRGQSVNLEKKNTSFWLHHIFNYFFQKDKIMPASCYIY